MVSGVLIRRPDSLLSLAEISGYIGVCGAAPVTLWSLRYTKLPRSGLPGRSGRGISWARTTL